MKKNEFEKLLNFYQKIEQEKKNSTPNRLRQIFATNAFDHVGYPKYLNYLENITNYIDEMHEEKKEIKKYSFSKKEFELIQKVFDYVEKAQENLNIKKKILPYSALITSFGILRIIKKLFKERSDIRVFEIGPGSGYTGILLIEEGFKYSCTENTQGFYLWQSQLFSEISKDFDENFNEVKLFKNDKKISHIPWWEFLKLFKLSKNEQDKVDLIVCDHALGEVSVECLKYIAKLSQNILEKKQSSFFLFRAPGKAVFSDYWEILRVFREYGFVNIQFNNFIVFISKNSLLGKELNIKNIIPNKKPNRIMNKVLLTLNRILGFRLLKKRKKELYELKNYDCMVSNENYKTFKDIYEIIAKKKMISKKYEFFDYINKKKDN
jgi:hypothetical protein